MIRPGSRWPTSRVKATESPVTWVVVTECKYMVTSCPLAALSAIFSINGEGPTEYPVPCPKRNWSVSGCTVITFGRRAEPDADGIDRVAGIMQSQRDLGGFARIGGAITAGR